MATRTNSLKKVVKDMFTAGQFTCPVTHGNADPVSVFPHVVYFFDSVSDEDLSRHDYTMIVDVYDRGSSSVTCDELADKVENMFNNSNKPQADILPTFFLKNRRAIRDEDKLVHHRQLTIQIQNYEVI